MLYQEPQIQIKRYSIDKEIAHFALIGLSGEQAKEGRVLIQAIVNDWLSQADESDLEDILQIGKTDLAHTLQGQLPAEKLTTLRNLVLERQVQKLSTRAFGLARQVVNREQTYREAKMEANMVNAEVRRLLEKVKKVQDTSVKRRLLRDLADADLECLYVLNGAAGAMSRRLNRSTQPIPIRRPLRKQATL